MFGNWYEMYWLMKQRQKELGRKAERWRLIAALHGSPPSRLAGAALAQRLGLLLVRWGTALQRECGDSLCECQGRQGG